MTMQVRFESARLPASRIASQTLPSLQRTAQKAPFFHKTGMNGRSFRAGWDGALLVPAWLPKRACKDGAASRCPLSRGKRSERHATATSWSDRKKTAQKE